jgi:hypothetical protein
MAGRTVLQRRIQHTLEIFELQTALLTFIGIGWHTELRD